MDSKQKAGLVEEAREGAKMAYAPYSDFHVGAAVLLEDGRIFRGCNVENASYGLTCCAERNALFKCISEGGGKVVALAPLFPRSYGLHHPVRCLPAGDHGARPGGADPDGRQGGEIQGDHAGRAVTGRFRV
jgi:cytidine deaminase